MIYEKVRISMCCAKSLQSCLTLCDPIDSSPSGSLVPGVLQARTLEWVAISFSNAWKQKVKVKPLSHVRLFATLWTAAHQAPPPMGFPRQEYWSGVPLPSPKKKKLRWFLLQSGQNLQIHLLTILKFISLACNSPRILELSFPLTAWLLSLDVK